MINPLTTDFSDNAFALAMQAQKISDQEDISGLASGIVFLLGAADLLRQEVPEARYDCEKLLGELRSLLDMHYLDFLEHYLRQVFQSKEEQEELAQIIQFPVRVRAGSNGEI
jgi:hypothetical protein